MEHSHHGLCGAPRIWQPGCAGNPLCLHFRHAPSGLRPGPAPPICAPSLLPDRWWRTGLLECAQPGRESFCLSVQRCEPAAKRLPEFGEEKNAILPPFPSPFPFPFPFLSVRPLALLVAFSFALSGTRSALAEAARTPLPSPPPSPSPVLECVADDRNVISKTDLRSNDRSALEKADLEEGKEGFHDKGEYPQITQTPEDDAKFDSQDGTTMAAASPEKLPIEEIVELDELQQSTEDWKLKSYKLTVPLRVVALSGSMPPTWFKDFTHSQGRSVQTTVEYKASLNDIIKGIAPSKEKRWINLSSAVVADLVTVGDSWLSSAICEGLVEPIKDAEQQEWFQRLGPRWQALIQRNAKGYRDQQGKVWGVPYRWGTMVIAYKKDKLAAKNILPIQDWKDLWRPEFTGKISMVDSPREVVGIVLKSLDASYNSQNWDMDVQGGKEAVKNQFMSLRKQVRHFDNVHYLKSLGVGDVWVAVGWSCDVIPIAKRMSNITVVVPSSGTSMWADLWAVPAVTNIENKKTGGRVRGPSPLIHQWLDFCLQPARALPFLQGVFVGSPPLSLFQGSTTPISHEHISSLIHPNNTHEKRGPRFDSNMVQGLPPLEIMEKSEFLEPLSDKAVSDFHWLLTQTPKRPHNIWGSISTFCKMSKD